jgi:hypothetical protein
MNNHQISQSIIPSKQHRRSFSASRAIGFSSSGPLV